MRFFLCFALSSLLLTSSAVAQKIKLLDKVHLKEIPEVYIFSGNNYVVTNQYGMADVSDFARTETIVIQHRDYNTFSCSYEQLKNMDYLIYLTPNIIHVEEIVVSANRVEQNMNEIPNKIITLRKDEIELYNPQTAADLLKISDEVFVQKSQLGGGSPMIRGYAANRVLIVTDGVRMNNAVFRSGNLQNVISLDPNAIENTEIIFGPGSVVYGSDAIGGVMNFTTLKARISGSESSNNSIRIMSRYASANREKTGHINFNIGSEKTAFRTSFSYSDFDDLKMGAIGHEEYQRPEYVHRPYHSDVIEENEDPNIQKFSGYSQMNFMQKIRIVPNSVWDVNYAFHFSETSDVPRYDRLTEYSGDSLKYAEWYYGPQVWQMQSLTAEYTEPARLYDEIIFTGAYQNFKESRHDRKFQAEEIRERFENVHAYSANLDFHKTLFNDLKLFYGFEYLQNKVRSDGQLREIVSNIKTNYASRYPDNSDYFSAAGYFSFHNPLSDKLNVSGGLRYNTIFIRAPFDTTFYAFPFEKIDSQTGALTGSLGLTYQPNTEALITFNFATGFRAPNIDDLGKVFDSEPGNVIVPNPNLEPEYAYNFDLGYTQRIGESIQTRVSVFYSYLKNAFVRDDFTFNGEDSILYDGEMSRVQALVNADNAQVYGLHASLKSNLGEHFAFKTNANYTHGFDSENKPLRHVSPFFANAHVFYTRKQFKIDFYTVYNGEISYENLAESERDKTYMYATDGDGNPYSPSWYTFNISVIWQINKVLKLNAAVENILNHRYRPYSSGIVAPGRNFILSLSLELH